MSGSVFRIGGGGGRGGGFSDPLDPDTRELQRLSRGASIKVNYTNRF